MMVRRGSRSDIALIFPIQPVVTYSIEKQVYDIGKVGIFGLTSEPSAMEMERGGKKFVRGRQL